MIPAIAFMAGCYILVRMLSLLYQPAPLLVRLAAVATMLITAATMVGLWFVPAPAFLR